MSLAQSLLTWYRESARDLPWRRSRDAYAIWVSEVMLQQTRVDTAIPYYLRFLERFPSITALAGASDEDVRSTWSGLGYYRRARMLHQAAKRVAASGGSLPRQPQELERLPGFGPYTAAAVASIAFGAQVAVVDGNVERVATRLAAIPEDPKSSLGRKRVLAVAEGLLVVSSAGDSNQALMELGATVCLPRNPRCAICPLQAGCVAFERGEIELYPRLAPRPQARGVRLAAVLVEKPGLGVLLRRRGDFEAVLPGTWEPPWIELVEREPAAQAILRAFPALVPKTRLGTARHTITTRRYTIEVWRGVIAIQGETAGHVAESVGELESQRYVLPAELSCLPTSALARKILAFANSY